MPRRKQNCPKRMKWELENAEGAARGEGGDKKPDGGKGEMSGGSDNDNDNDMGSDSDESVDNIPTTSSRESSPPSPPSSHSSQKNGGASAILDFSRGPCGPPVSSPPSMISPLTTRKHNRGDNTGGGGGGGRSGMGDSPLDLSVSHKKPTKEDDGPLKKLPKWSPSSIDSTPTTTPLIANHHHHHQNRERKNSWNGNHSPDIKALEKMSEMSRGGGGAQDGVGGKLTSPSSGRGSSSSWQAQWLAQNSTGTREIFKCVVCRSTFNTLAALSVHMKESKHGPPMPNLPSPKMPPQQSPQHPPVSTPTGGSSSSASDSSSLLLKGTGGGHKETVQLPRKLVRGQDVWLGKGAEQTRQILKCMWCGTSFRSLAEMTAHMQQTQHYTNIISQEQLISWRSSDDKSSSTNSHVSAVLTCKVCDQAFSSLKDLSNHMVKNQHYKEHIMRSITESGSRRRQSREKRKKSLPVRKLLELERASQEMKKEIRISCEKCSEKIPGPLFVEHLRVCGTSHSHSGSGASSGGSSPLKQTTPSPKLDGHGGHSGRESSGTGELDLSLGGGGGGAGKDKSDGDNNKNEQSSAINAIEKMIEKSFDYRSAVRSQPSNIGPSPPIGSRSASSINILKRLGIDESVDYTKPLMEHSGLLPLPPSGKYSIPQSRRSRSRSASSDHSISEDLTRSKSNSNSSSPALPSNDNDAGSLKSPLSLCNNNIRSNTKSPASDSLGGDHSTDQDGDAISDDNQSEHNSITAATNKRKHKAITNKSSSNNNHNKKSRQKQNSLSALSSMFESIGGSGASGGQGGRDGDHNNSNSKNSSGFPSNSHHPLAALQKLCDKTENSPGNGTAGGGDREGGRGSVNSRPTSTSSSNPQSSPEPSLLGLNWAAAAANASAGDASDGNVFKCTFCDTPFLSKGAYRLHLAKMHFVKESSKSPHQDLNSANNKDGSGGGGGANPSGVVEPTINSSDSPASKLMKYAELAKQLSSK